MWLKFLSMFLAIHQEVMLTERAASRISLALVLYMSLKREGLLKMSNKHVDNQITKTSRTFWITRITGLPKISFTEVYQPFIYLHFLTSSSLAVCRTVQYWKNDQFKYVCQNKS